MKQLGLIGYPLGHSFSKKYFSEKFAKEGIEGYQYDLYEMQEVDALPELLQKHKDLIGFNVTIPHKRAVIAYLDQVEDNARKIGAVNVVKVTTGKLLGYNSDFYGFKACLQGFIPHTSLKALVLGSGGSSMAVAAALEALGIPFLRVSRSKGKGDLSYDEISDSLIQEHRLIINTTPLGMSPQTDTCPNLPYPSLSSNHYLFDLVYNPEQTLFMKKGQEQGARVKNGHEMLILQAEKSWEIWTNDAV